MKTAPLFIFMSILIVGAIFFVGRGTEDRPVPRKETAVFQEDARKDDFSVIEGVTYFVSPSGDDDNDGRSEATAFATIQKAMDMMMPGDGAVLLDGTYFQDFASVRDGEKGRRIVVKGTERAIVKGSGEKDHIAEIRHDHIVLFGFSIDGLGGGDGSKKKHYRDRLVHIEGREPMRGVTGAKIIGMHLSNAGGECLRIRYFSRENEVAYNTVRHCGVYDFRFDSGGKNGEGVYIGTAPEQARKGKNITKDVDASDDNWIHHNDIDTQGNECVDIKEGSSGNLVENNICTGQKDPESAGLDSRGNGNIFRDNESFGNVGAGIRLGGDRDEDGIDNSAIENFLHDNENGGIKIQRVPQRLICGNRFADNEKGDLVGEFGPETGNREKCGG